MSGMCRVAALASLACLGAACSPRVDFERMRQQRRADPFEASEAFADGRAMRLPPAGTVRYEQGNRSSGAPFDARAAAPSGEMPIRITPETIARGQHEFDAFCAVCHGESASGRSVMAVNIPGNPPPSLLSAEIAARPTGELFNVISNGKNRMPAYAWALPEPDRWAVIAYVRHLQAAAAGERR